MLHFISRIRIGYRISGSFIVSIAVILAIILPTLLMTIDGIIDRAIEEEVEDHHAIFLSLLDTTANHATSLAALVADMPAASEAMAAGDRDRLLQLFAPAFKRLKAEQGLEQMQFHTPPATSFLRIHSPAKFGDDLSDFRKTVVEANTARRVVKGLESGVAGLGIRAVVPIAAGGRHLGTIEFGFGLGQQIIEAFKAQYDVEMSLHAPKDGALASVASTLGNRPSILGADALQAALTGGMAMERVSLNDQPKVVLAVAIPDYTGKPAVVMEMATDISHYVGAFGLAQRMTAAATVVALTLATGLAMLVHRTVVRPLERLTRSMESLAGGDLEVSIPTLRSTDEIGKMAKALAVFREAIRERRRLDAEQAAETERKLARQAKLDALARDFSTGIHGLLGVVNKSVEEVAAAAQSLIGNARSTSDESATVATASDQATASVKSVAAAAEELAASVADIGRQVLDSRTIADQAATQANGANARIQSMTQTAGRIANVLSLINEIAARTNLLALNATIEAARAGEAGKGFAVVAGEVKQLASQTAKATDEIAGLVTAVQGESTEAVSAIEVVTATIGRINEISTAIAAAVEQQGAATLEIARNAQQAANGTGEVSQRIVSVARIAASTSNAAEQVAHAAEHVSERAEVMKENVNRFVAGVNTLS
ncbi:MAG TPA: cache domain-containing protein [Azospirillaceae bacterium]|nr:cache domain-containing protein [Azospirillaceae bacterium]